jgi:hypothetical protein
MALRRVYKKKFQGVNMKSGYFYKFKYRPYRRDPKPLIILMHSIEGTHQNSGHQWRLFQAINFTYVPRAMRKRFLKVWMKEMEKPGMNRPGALKFTWQKVLRKYPYIQMGIRRYQFKPSGYITNLEQIPDDRIEKEVIKSLSKDFSKRVSTGIRGLLFRRKQAKEKAHRQKQKQKKAQRRNKK